MSAAPLTIHSSTAPSPDTLPAQEAPYLVAAFYKFVDWPDYAQRKPALLAVCEQHQVKGSILLAAEGINSTIAGPPAGVRAVLAYLRQEPLLRDLEHKESYAYKAPFHRMKVRLKKEIVTMQVPDLNPARMAGKYVPPSEWNALISDPGVVLIDTRNDYEVEMGTFVGARNPHIKTFSELPAWLEQSRVLAPQDGSTTAAKPKVAMFCTGGIRCEKSTALLRAQGYEEVYHLEGGILKYLETISPENSLWEGQCFVFDERVSVGHGLVPGQHNLCRACRQPLEDGATQSPHYEIGVSCPRCHAHTSEQQKNSARERHRQWELAKARQGHHIGDKIPDIPPH